MEASKHNVTYSPPGYDMPTLTSLPWHIIAPTVVISYLTLVQILRFRALRRLEKKYAAYLEDPYRLDYKQAQEIMQLSMLHDEPFLFAFGTQWALVKSYGIASGTPLLVQTRQLCDAGKVGRRAEDTAIFLGEFLAGDLDGERGRLAMARLNWLHGRYRISEGDYVHTLALFVLEPQRWIERYGWRAMTRLEKVAHLVYWREIGHRMGFGGIPATLEALEAWKAAYEETHLYYIPENRMVTDATVDVFLRKVPRRMRGMVKDTFVSFIEEEKVRAALGYADPPAWATALTTGFFRLRGLLIRYLALPRSRALDPLAKPGADGRLYRSPEFVGFEPWYVADTWYNRMALWFKAGGNPSMQPGRFQSRGFLPEELGPAGLEKVAAALVRRQAMAMEEYVKSGGSAGVGCPFKFVQ
ncbi:hypothetical protein F5Y15DRAFT_416628 [Xylariaceae sp. FL0016]|nr:hypothetical protein F5Y15DRAFT_416628 [Xylariaceae sp. FL0016]